MEKNNDKIKEFNMIKDLLDTLGIKASAKIIDVTNGKELTADEFKDYLEKEICSKCDNRDECEKTDKDVITKLREIQTQTVEAYKYLGTLKKTRELAMVMTKIDEAMMWLDSYVGKEFM